MDDFIETGSGGGIGFGLCADTGTQSSTKRLSSVAQVSHDH
jgi:hypothetical protein